MSDTASTIGGFNVLDGAALVLGAAVASVHLRVPYEMVRGADSIIVWLVFAGVAATAAGPFVFLSRRFIRRPANYPQIPDRLWSLLGLPWIATAPFRGSPSPSDATRHSIYSVTLCILMGAAIACVLAVIWKTWVRAAPAADDAAARPWAERVGMAIAVCWPIQCGLVLVVIGGS